MTKAQKTLAALVERQSRERQRMAELSAADELTEETRAELDTIESGVPDLERQIRAARVAVETEEAEQREEARETEPDAEDRERAELRGKVRLARYIGAAVETRAADGAEAEYNAALGIGGNKFPLELLAPPAPEKRGDTEERATTDAQAAAMQSTWLDRLFSETAAMRVGITFEGVGPGVRTHPVVTAGASAAQRGRGETAADAAWTVAVTEIGPSRNTVRAVFATEDADRLPGLEAALRRDLSAALTEGVDRAIFLGDAGADEAPARIVGLNTAGIQEITLTQANKVKAPETLAVFAGLVDGKHASALGDLMICASVGANTLWLSQIAAAAADTKTLASFLMENGLSWGVRGDIAAATAANAFGAFIGRGRGIAGAGVAAIWQAGELIRDAYTRAADGEVALTLSHRWGFKLPRPSNFARLKFVA